MEAVPLSPEQIEQLIAQQPEAAVLIVLQQAAAIVQQGELIQSQEAAIKALEQRVEQLEKALRQSRGGAGDGA